MGLNNLGIDGQETAAVAAKLAYALHEAEQTPKTAGGLLNAKPFIVLNGEVKYVDEVFDKPSRKNGLITFSDAKSLIAVWKGQAVTGVSDMYGSLDPVKFTAVFNDHGIEPGFRDHRADYLVKHSKEWETWMKHNGAGAAFGGNEEFGFFVENHASDFLDPAGAAMLEIALNFRASNNVAFKNVVRLADGNVDLAYSEVVSGESAAVDARGTLQKVSIPEKFKISIPVFAGVDQPLYELEARFRFRIAGGGLKIWYDIVEPHKAIEKAFKDICQKIEDGIGQEILFGIA